MTVELRDLIGDLAVHAVAAADSMLSSLFALYSAGASNGVDPVPLVVGGGAGGVAGAGAAYGGGGGRNDPARNPRIPATEEDVGDATSPYQRSEWGRDGAPPERSGPGPLERIARQNQKWAEAVMGVDTVGTRGPRSDRAESREDRPSSF